MRTIDFAPYTRSAIGFDRLFDIRRIAIANSNDMPAATEA